MNVLLQPYQHLSYIKAPSTQWIRRYQSYPFASLDTWSCKPMHVCRGEEVRTRLKITALCGVIPTPTQRLAEFSLHTHTYIIHTYLGASSMAKELTVTSKIRVLSHILKTRGLTTLTITSNGSSPWLIQS